MLDSRPRRRLLASLVALAALPPRALRAAPTPDHATPHATSPSTRAPVARVEPVRETLWGETLVDPYRWMERRDDPEWLPYMRGQAAHARAVLDALPGRAALRRRIDALSGALAVAQTPVTTANGRVFHELRAAGDNQFKLVWREGEQGAPRVLIDPSTMREGDTHVSLDWWRASPDGRHVVMGLSPAGSENAVARIVEVDTGRALPERIDRVPYAEPSWLPDGSGFFYNRLAEGVGEDSVERYLDTVAWLHRLGTDPKHDRRVLARGQYPELPVDRLEFPNLIAQPGSPWVVALPYGGVRRQNAVHVARLADLLDGRPAWRRVAGIEDEVVDFALRGDELFLLSTLGAPNGRVLRLSLAEATLPPVPRAPVVVPEGDAVIDGIAAARDGLYLRDMRGGYGGLRRLDRQGRLDTVSLPFEGTIEFLATRPTQDGAWIDGTGWLLPFTCMRIDADRLAARAVALAPPSTLDLGAYRAIRSEAVARDGTRVPLSIVLRRDRRPDGRRPTLVEAYGSYQTVSNPYFSARRLALLDQGGVFATAHVRGGGEYGRRWWLDGQKLAKPNTWRDLIDCCEALVRQGWTSPRHLAIQGGSAGGITVGRALTERPDLFCAVVSNVGVSNALRAEFSPNGPPNIDEFGTVTERAGFLGLKQMDAMHAVRDDVRYPAVLLTTGMTDPRVEPWQVAKMTARLQAVPVQRAPVLMRVDFDAGHGIGSTRAQVDDLVTDEFAFVLWQAGVPGFQPRA